MQKNWYVEQKQARAINYLQMS